jgi:hypothetical protein
LIAGQAMDLYGPNGFPYSLAIVLAIFLVAIGLRERAKRRAIGR